MLNKSWLDNITLKQILIIAFIPRIIAALFSGGYAMSDDHFLVIEVAKAWSQGIDIANWFTQSPEDITSGRGILYPGLHYLLFTFLDFIGIDRLSTQMFFVRTIHAFYALLPVYFIYRITELTSNRKYAAIASLCWALLWFVPYMSIKNLVEMAAIPPLMWGVLISLRALRSNGNPKIHFWVGLLFGVVFSIRYQAALFPVGYCLGLLLQKHYREFAYAVLAGVLWVGIFHGLGDYLMSGAPFGKVKFYIDYNLSSGSTNYINQPWYQYFIVIAGFMVPPLGLFWLIGSFKFKKKLTAIFCGVAVFFVAHSLFNGKQERFVFTIMPFILILGVAGWYNLVQAKNKSWLYKLTKSSWYFAIPLNIIVLLLVSIWYSKSSKVRLMDYFYHKAEAKSELYVVRFTGKGKSNFPRAYSGQFPEIIHYTPDSLNHIGNIEKIKSQKVLIIERMPKDPMDDFLPILEKSGLTLKYETSFGNSLIDGIHYNMNPRNVNNYEYDIFRIR